MLTPLLPLAPLASGTRDVESFTSYLLRLAAVHGVTPQQMFCVSRRRHEHLPETAPICLPQVSNRDGPIATSAYGHRLARIIAERTGTAEVENLNWWRQENRNSVARLTSSVTKWCPICLMGDAEPYFRAAWDLAASTRCVVHDCFLLRSCACCQNPVSLFRRSLLGCPHCGSDLRMPAAPSANDERNFAIELGELVATLDCNIGILQFTRPASTLLRWCTTSGVSSIKGQARWLGLSPSTVCAWQRDETRIAFASVIEICRNHGLSPVRLLHGEAVRIGSPGSDPGAKAWVRKPPAAVAPVAAILRRHASSAASPSLRVIGRRLNLDKRSLRRCDPQACRDIVARNAELSRRLGRAQQLVFKAHALYAIATLEQTQSPVTFRNVVAQFFHPGLWRHPERRAFIKQAIQLPQAGGARLT